ncbi:MAG: hypothetical protein N2442_04485 [Spirochaetes bacterium]|nr:hypothetical protein [Spirochaetota bacterium]
MPVRKTVILLVLVALWYRMGAEAQDRDAFYIKYALDGKPLAILHSAQGDEVWVVTDANSLVRVRWQGGIQKQVPLPRGVKGAFPRFQGGVLIWFSSNEIQWYNSNGGLVRQFRVENDAVRLVQETMGGYALVETEESKAVLYSLAGNKLLEWKREGAPSLPLQISDQDTILDAQTTGHCVVRRIDGTILTKLHFPHPLLLVSWVGDRILLGVSPDGKATLLNQDGKELGSRILFPTQTLLYPSMIQISRGGTVSYLDLNGYFHVSSLEEGSDGLPRSYPLNLQNSQPTALGVSSTGISICVGDSQWILHWIRVPDEKLPRTSRKAVLQYSVPNTFLLNPAEQYFMDLVKSPFPRKNLQLLEETKNYLRDGNLHWILLEVKKGLQALITREELGATLRVDAVLLLGRIGDGFDGEWLGKRLIEEKEQVVRRSILEALYPLSVAPNEITRKDLFTYLRSKRKTLDLLDLRLSLVLLDNWIKSSGFPLRQDEMETLSSLAAENPQFSRPIVEFIRR